jgi:hypothetical protein
MSGPRPASIILPERQRSLLERLRRCQAASVRLARRVAVLAPAEGPCLESAASRLRLTRVPALLWRGHWLDAADRPRAAEAGGLPGPGLLGLIEAALDDAPRPGGPAAFTPEQIVGVVAAACEVRPPDRPLDRAGAG